MPDNMVAQNALNQHFYNWGLHPWETYGVMGIILALSLINISEPTGQGAEPKAAFVFAFCLLGSEMFIRDRCRVAHSKS